MTDGMIFLLLVVNVTLWKTQLRIKLFNFHWFYFDVCSIFSVKFDVGGITMTFLKSVVHASQRMGQTSWALLHLFCTLLTFIFYYSTQLYHDSFGFARLLNKENAR